MKRRITAFTANNEVLLTRDRNFSAIDDANIKIV